MTNQTKADFKEMKKSKHRKSIKTHSFFYKGFFK